MSVNQSQQLPSPIKLKRITESDNRGIALEIIWSNNKTQIIKSETLRKFCPCASCMEQRGDNTHNQPFSPKKKSALLKVVEATIEESTDLKKIWLVGNYAIGILWGDKHDSGIYSFNLLTSLN